MLKNALKTIKTRSYDNDILFHDENQYLALIEDIIKEGVMVDGRNGKAKTVFGCSMNFNLENNILPLLTTKRVAWKTCSKERLHR